MARMTAPNGATVSVSDERAKLLAEQGYKPISEKSPAKKPASSKSEK